jgi:hypothetical protein
MFLALFLVFIATLVIAGVGRLTAVLIMAVFGRLQGEATVDVVRLPVSLAPHPASGPAGELTAPGPAPASAAATTLRTWPQNLKQIPGMLRRSADHLPLFRRALRSPAEMSADWAAAVARADARAVARARASTPAIDVVIPEVPPPGVLPEQVTRVAPLVESALGQGPNRSSTDAIPRSFRKPPTPGTEALLDTGSLVSLSTRPRAESVK